MHCNIINVIMQLSVKKRDTLCQLLLMFMRVDFYAKFNALRLKQNIEVPSVNCILNNFCETF